MSIERSKRTITNWESGSSFPDASDLLKLAGLGFDIGYVLFGIRSVEKNFAQYEAPARVAAAEIAGMRLSEEDAELLVALAKRISTSV